MPVFQYRCGSCGGTVRKLVAKFDEKVVCAKCGKRMTKLPSLFASPAAGAASPCAMAETCPSAGHHECGCNCGCGHHRG